MTHPAREIAAARRTYRGGLTNPDRWATWTPRSGDILVTTPPKNGTTWTQAMLAMLVHGGTQLPNTVSVLSPWVDSNIGTAEDVTAALAVQNGRRVLKTHTPADGFPIWEGVTVVAVYRHPLDMFFSHRKHMANMKDVADDHPMLLPLSASLRAFVEGTVDPDDFERETLASYALHYQQTVLSGRLPDLKLFHYADMIRGPRRAVQGLARAAGIDAAPAVIDAVTDATSFGAMKANAAAYAPGGGTGIWKNEAAFFDAGTSGKWEGQLSREDLDLYADRFAALIPDRAARHWLENGTG